MMAETLLQIIEGAPRSLTGQLARRGAGRPGKPKGEPSTILVRRRRERGRTSPAKDRETGPRSRGRRSGRGPDRNAPTMDNTPGGRRRRRREGRRRSATRRRRWTTGQEVVTDGDVDAAARRQSADQGRDAPVPASQDVVDDGDMDAAASAGVPTGERRPNAGGRPGGLPGGERALGTVWTSRPQAQGRREAGSLVRRTGTRGPSQPWAKDLGRGRDMPSPKKADEESPRHVTPC